MQQLCVQNPTTVSLFTPSLLPRTLLSFRLHRSKALTLNKKTSFSIKSLTTTSSYHEQQNFPESSSVTAPQFPRVFVGHSIYKGKASLTVDPRAPEFVPLDSGAYKLAKEGMVLLQFAPAIGSRQYDWSRKQVFSLSVSEIGTIMSLGAKDLSEFYHDPFKEKSEEGKIRKILKAESLPDGSGHFFNLNVQNRMLNIDESIYVPITRAELTVLNSAFNFIIPHLLGFHAFTNSIRPEDSLRSGSATRSGAELEWGR